MDEIAALFFFLILCAVGLVLCALVGRFAEARGGSFIVGFLFALFLTPFLGFLIIFMGTEGLQSNSSTGTRISGADYVRAEEIKLELRRTELRWGTLRNSVAIVTLAAVSWYLYRHPGPLRPLRDRLVSLMASPADTAPPANGTLPVSLRQYATVAEAQREALRLHPELGVAGSPFNTAFLARHKIYQEQKPDFFQNSGWPVRLAEEVAAQVPAP